MNVAFDKWIPVLKLNGDMETVSLHELMTNGQKYSDISVLPYERVVLIRLFTCVTHAALNGPKDYEEWNDVPNRLSEEVDAYLHNWKDYFELFDPEKPWLQVPTLVKKLDDPNAKWSSVSKLFFSFATGDNSTLYDRCAEKNNKFIFKLEKVLLSMLSFQYFFFGGTTSQVFWNNQQTRGSLKKAPGISPNMLHSTLKGKNILETIHLNLVSYEDILFYYKKEIGRPIWEFFPETPEDTEKIKNATQTYVGRLMPITHVIKLSSDCQTMLLGGGLFYPRFEDGFVCEPTASIVQKKKNGKLEDAPLNCGQNKNLWRELGSIIVKKNADNGVGGPLSFLNLKETTDCELVVSSLQKALNNPVYVYCSESIFNLTPSLQSDSGQASYLKEVQFAENLSYILGKTIETYLIEKCGKNNFNSSLKQKANILFWTAVEKNLDLLIAHVEANGTDQMAPTKEVWRKMINKTTQDIFKSLCEPKTAREQKGFCLGLKKLFYLKQQEEKGKIILSTECEELDEELEEQ